MDWAWLLKMTKDYGAFVVLVAYVLWDTHHREIRYINIIDKLSESFQEIKKDVEVIKERLWR